jgi:hypothetical protein
MSNESIVPRISVWHLLDGAGQMVTASGAEGRLEMTVGCAPGYSADAPDYTVLLSRAEAASLGRALLAWAEAE